MNKDCQQCLKNEELIRKREVKVAKIRNTKARYCHNELLLEALSILLEIEKKKLDQLILDKNLHLLRNHG